MPQGTRTSSFVFTELMNVALGAIPEPNGEPSLLTPDDEHGPTNLAFYIDDVFGAHTTWEEQFTFLRDHFFPRMLWSRLKLSFEKLKIGMTRIKALGEDHEVGGRVRIRPEKCEKILRWPEPQNVTEVRGFLGTVGTARKWIRNFAELARPLARLTGNVEWKWGESELVSFQVVRNLAAGAGALFGWDPKTPVHVYTDASGYGAGCHITQMQGGTMVPIVYDSFTLTKAMRNYDTYKRELLAIVTFTSKFAHMLNAKEVSIVHADHKPLASFMNSDYHEDIFARWANKLRKLHVRITYIKGEKNKAADGLSRALFDREDCSMNEIVKELAPVVMENKDNVEWFWKTGKGGYRAMLKELTEKKRQEVVEEYGNAGMDVQNIVIHPVGWMPWCPGEEEVGPGKKTRKRIKAKDMGLGAPGRMIAEPGYCAAKVTNHQSNLVHVRNAYANVPNDVNEVRDWHYDSEDSSEEIDYSKEEWYADIYTWCRTGRRPKHLDTQGMGKWAQQLKNYRLDERNNTLLHKCGEFWTVCLAKSEIAPVLKEVHDESGHFSSKIVIDKIRHRFWWPNMASDVRKYVQGCLACARWAHGGRTVPLSPIKVDAPFDLFGMDFIGPFEKAQGCKYALRIVDYFSRFMWVYYTLGAKTKDALRCILDFVHTYPRPAAIYMDIGKHFVSKKMNRALRAKGIRVIPAPSASHKSVGMVESSNQIWENTMRKIQTQDECDWVSAGDISTMAVNSRYTEHLGYSPVNILYGVETDLVENWSHHQNNKHVRITEDTPMPSEEAMCEAAWDFMADRAEIRDETSERSNRAKDRQKERYDKGVRRKEFSPGQLVMRQDPTPNLGKLDPRWTGPFVIHGFAGEHRASYKLKRMDGTMIPNSFHGDHLRLFEPRQGYLKPEDEPELKIAKRIRFQRRRANNQLGVYKTP